jgi:hypothetical protein
MATALDLLPLTGPIRISVTSEAPIALRLFKGPIGIRILGQPGPQGSTGPQGDKGEQGAPGITILPTDAPINGGFF